MSQPSVAVVVDSAASLPADLLEREAMIMAPYQVHVKGKAYRDTIDITPCDLAEHMLGMEHAEDVPKTAIPSLGDYERAFGVAARRASAIVSFHMTSLGSGAYQAACVASDHLADQLKGVTIQPVDTLNVSMAHGWIALQAARLANAGATLGQVLALAERCKASARMLQTADTLRYLYLGGRIGRAKHLVGSLLQIRPLVTMEQGEIATLGVARTRASALERMADLVARDANAGRGIRLALTHFAAEKEALKLAALVRERVNVVEELMCELSPSLCVHSGPGTVGLCYLPDVG